MDTIKVSYVFCLPLLLFPGVGCQKPVNLLLAGKCTCSPATGSSKLNAGYLVEWQASAWEHTAVLSEDQERALELLSEHCAQRPVPEHVSALPQSRSVGSPASVKQCKLTLWWSIAREFTWLPSRRSACDTPLCLCAELPN